MEIKIISTEKYPGASLILYSGEKEILKEVLDLSPEKSSIVGLAEPAGKNITIILKSSSGEELAKYESPLAMPETVTPEPPSYLGKAEDQMTAAELYLMAQKYDRSLDRSKAREYYSRVLRIDSLHTGALRDLAVLDFEAGEYENAEELFSKALEQIPNDDGIAWYFLGLCKLGQNEFDAAIKCGFKASRCQGTESIGFDLAGRGFMLQKNFKDALAAFEKGNMANQNNASVINHFVIALYADGQKEKAEEITKMRIGSFPTELVPRALEAIILDNPKKLASDTRKFAGEYDFEMLEASIAFSEIGLFSEAAWILENSCINGVEEKDQNHLVQYHLAWLYSQTGYPEKSSDYLLRASENYQDFIFASRPETFQVLGYAVNQNPDDALAFYQLGNLCGNSGRLEEAAGYWNKAVQLDPGMSIPWRNLGWYHWAVNKDHGQSELCFRNAIKARPDDQTLYRDLAGVLTDGRKRPEAIALLEQMPVKGMRRSDIIIDLAQAYLDDGRFDESINLLKSTPYFVNWEGSSITWNIFSKAHIMKGIDLFAKKKYKDALSHFEASLTFPENLGVGKSARTEEAEAWFWKGKTLVALNKPSEALQAWQNGSFTPADPGRENIYRNMCRALLK